jgi:hypothetical protein
MLTTLVVTTHRLTLSNPFLQFHLIFELHTGNKSRRTFFSSVGIATQLGEGLVQRGRECVGRLGIGGW